MDALDRIKILCIEHGITVSKLERELGYSNGSINNKKGKGISLSNKRLVEVADFFGVTVDYILTGREEKTPFYYTDPETAKLAQDYFTEAELKHMIKNIDMQDVDIIVTMCLTGLRPSELLNLNVDNVDIENRIIKNVGIKTEKGKAKRIPISSIILPYLEKRRSESQYELFSNHGKVMTYYYFLNSVYKPCLERLEAVYKSPKACRHTFANLTHKRLSDKARTSIIGHTDMKLTDEVYTDLEDHVLWEEFNNVEEFLTNF